MRTWLTAVLVFALALVFMVPVVWLVPFDFYEYMMRGLRLALGFGYTGLEGETLVNRPPLYSAIIALVILVSGPSMTAMMWLQGAIAALNVTLLFTATRRWFGETAGLVAVCLALVSGLLHPYLVNHIDPWWSASLLAFLIAQERALRGGGGRWWIIGGVFLGVAYNFKEATIIMLPAPFLSALWLGGGQVRERLRTAALAYAAAVPLMVPWALYTMLNADTGPLSLLGAYGGRLVSGAESSPGAGLAERGLGFVTGFLKLWYDKSHMNTLAWSFALTPGYAVAWLYAFWRATRGDWGFRYLVLVFVLLAPFVAVVGAGKLRMGQLDLFILLSMATLAGGAMDIIGRLAPSVSTRRLAGGLAASLFITAEAFGPGVGYLYVHFQFLNKDPGEYLLRPRTEGLAAWTMANLGSGAKIMATDFRAGKMLYWDTRGGVEVKTLDFDTYDYFKTQVKFNYSKDKVTEHDAMAHLKEKPVAIATMLARQVPVVFMLRERRFFAQLKDCDYVMVSYPWHDMAVYMDAHPAFTLVTEYTPPLAAAYYRLPIRMYRVEQSKLEPLHGWKPVEPKELGLYLQPLKERHPEAYQWYRERLAAYQTPESGGVPLP